jgi:pyruvate/2-oxoglutarate dehydrogenase complex dihydrolipoamide acyltransferase (E2) component
MTEGRDQDSRRPAMERADELLNRAGWVAGMVGSMVGMRLARIAAFAREEAEDLWAEAQTMRRQNRVNLGAAPSKVADTAREKAQPKQEAEPDAKVETVVAAGPDGGVETIEATAAARRHAEELGVDLRQVEGTGEGGRITAVDVKRKAKANFVN